MVNGATGVATRVSMFKETTYGTAPAAEDYWKMPFMTTDLGSQQALVASGALGMQRDPTDPLQDAPDLTGNMVVPVDARYIGLWLAMLLGAPTSTDHDTYNQHIFKSGAATLPSYAIELGYLTPGQYKMETGLMANSMALDFTRKGDAQATFALIGQKEATAGASGAGTPAALTISRFAQINNLVKLNGTALTNVLTAKLNFTNNLSTNETIGNSGNIGGIDAAEPALTGTLSARFTDETLIADAIAGTPVALTFGFSLSNILSLTILCPRVFLKKPNAPVTGPGGIQVDFDFTGSFDSATGAMMTATLLNDLDGTQYA